jgi:DNA polymerase-3 subunit delta'
VLYKDIVGQTEAKQRLLKMVNEDRVPHALLFSGREGCGNLPAALAMAQHLFCTARRADGACNACPSCQKVAKLVHPDLHLVFPYVKSKEKRIHTSEDVLPDFRETFLLNPYMSLQDWFGEIDAENKQPIIPVEESSIILRKLSYTSYEGSYKMVVIWQPEKMNPEASNRLLKILEEPPEKTIFILVSNAPDQLLSTIVSRVQQIPFYQCSDAEIAKALMQYHQVNENVSNQTALLANGNYGEALKLIREHDEQVSLLNDFQQFMRLALRFDGVKALDWIDAAAARGRESQKQFLQFGLEIFRDCLMYNYGEKSLVRLGGAEKLFLEKFAPFVNGKNYQALVEEFNNNYYYIERNAYPKLLFMDLLLKTNGYLNAK